MSKAHTGRRLPRGGAGVASIDMSHAPARILSHCISVEPALMHSRQRIRRIAHILGVLIRHAWALAGTTAVGRLPGLAWLFRVQPRSGPERLRALIEDLGGTFIKFG